MIDRLVRAGSVPIATSRTTGSTGALLTGLATTELAQFP